MVGASDRRALRSRMRLSAVSLTIPPCRDEVFPDLPLDKQRTEIDYLGPLFMALGVGADQDRGPAVEGARRRLLAHAASRQAEDGSWNANRGGRPPGHGPRDCQTRRPPGALSRPASRGAETG